MWAKDVVDPHSREGVEPKFRWTPILSGLIVPFSILLEIPGLTEHVSRSSREWRSRWQERKRKTIADPLASTIPFFRSQWYATSVVSLLPPTSVSKYLFLDL